MNIEYIDKIKVIEYLITSITGPDIEHSYKWISIPEQYNNVKILLDTRKNLMNEIFIPSCENMQRFRFLNDKLYNLTLQLFDRVNNLESKRIFVMDCPDFDDDYEINGTLKFCFNDEHSVLKLNDDKDIGSNFTLMIKLIADLSFGKESEKIEEFWPGSHILDDGMSWNEYPFCDKGQFDDIVICHAIHQLTTYQLYSIPDILRLNDFWAEVNFRVQSITEQNGNRYNSEKIERL